MHFLNLYCITLILSKSVIKYIDNIMSIFMMFFRRIVRIFRMQKTPLSSYSNRFRIYPSNLYFTKFLTIVNILATYICNLLKLFYTNIFIETINPLNSPILYCFYFNKSSQYSTTLIK